MRKSLFWRLSRIFFIVSIAGGALHVVGFLFVHGLFIDKVEQIHSWGLAEEYARELEPLSSPNFDRPALEEKIFRLEEQNPRIRIYILDHEGEVIYSSYGSPATVPLEPVLEFLSMDGFPTFPIYGVPPAHSPGEDRVPFSAAPLMIGADSGYLYVVLRGRGYRLTYRAVGDFVIVMGSACFMLALALVGTLIGMLLSHFFTKRFQNLTEAIARFTGGDYSTRVAAGPDDEVGLHGRAFNQMATTIQENFETLKENDNLRRQLIANISHDLRSPLGAMQSLLESLHSEFFSMDQQNQQTFLDRALANCQDLRMLVDDLFELSKLNAQTEMPELKPVHLLHLFRLVVKKFAMLAEKKDLAVLVDLPREFPRVSADEQMLNRAVSNLVENAIRYSEPGGEIRLSAAEGEQDMVVVSVSDRGMGIAENELDEVFERFYRGSRAAEKEKSGSGLGLAITKRIIELHDKNIWAESTLGEGSTFSFTLSRADSLS